MKNCVLPIMMVRKIQRKMMLDSLSAGIARSESSIIFLQISMNAKPQPNLHPHHCNAETIRSSSLVND